MDPLPMVPASCSLDEDGLIAQLSRYRRAGDGARVVEHSSRRVVLRVADQTSGAMIEELVAVERSCCPCFDLRWDRDTGELTVAVSRAQDEPALGAITRALAL